MRWILQKLEEKEEDPLAEDDFEFLVSIISKYLFGVIASALVNDMSTPALGETLAQLEQDGCLGPGKGLLADVLLEDCDDEGWEESWSRKILKKETPAFEVDVLIDRLWRSVNQKALDADQDKRVGRVLDAVERRFDWGKQKVSSVIEEIKGIRNLKKLSEEL